MRMDCEIVAQRDFVDCWQTFGQFSLVVARILHLRWLVFLCERLLGRHNIQMAKMCEWECGLLIVLVLVQED